MSEMKRLMDLQDAVVQLHNIARLVESEIGKGTISEDIRAAADSVSALIRYTVV